MNACLLDLAKQTSSRAVPCLLSRRARAFAKGATDAWVIWEPHRTGAEFSLGPRMLTIVDEYRCDEIPL